MKIARFQWRDETRYGAIDGDRVHEVTGDLDTGFEISGPLCGIGEVRLLAPTTPRSIVAIGINYPRRVDQFYGKSPQTERYENPVLFLIPLTSVIGPDDQVEFPTIGERLNASGELVAVIKKATRRISEDEVYGHILGYTCGNDLASPDVGRADSHQTLRAHGFDTATSVGPVIETDISPADLPVTLRVDRAVVSEGSTSDMIYSVETIISYISQFMTLHPGDLVFMGTPMGAAVTVGSDMEVEIGRIGTLRNRVVAAKG